MIHYLHYSSICNSCCRSKHYHPLYRLDRMSYEHSQIQIEVMDTRFYLKMGLLFLIQKISGLEQ